jgi:hypothetical protein
MTHNGKINACLADYIDDEAEDRPEKETNPGPGNSNQDGVQDWSSF